jgi:nucleotide-binding universal stress UspA family protein
MSGTIAAPRRIVVGIDGSDQSKQALRWGADLARMLDARLDAVIAWHFPTYYGYGWSVIPFEIDPAAIADKVIVGVISEVLGTAAPEDMRVVVAESNPAQLLIKESDGALMVVLGSRGHGGFGGLLLGSVSMAVAEHAACPVMVMHGSEPHPLAP